MMGTDLSSLHTYYDRVTQEEKSGGENKEFRKPTERRMSYSVLDDDRTGLSNESPV